MQMYRIFYKEKNVFLK